MTPRRLRGDRGQLGGMEVLPFGFLVFVTGSLVLVNTWGVIDAKLATTSAAREAARAYVESPPDGSASATAEARAIETMVAHGRDARRVGVTVPGPASLTRCARITVTVTYSVPAIAAPFTGGLGRGFTVSSTFTELVDPFREGLAGAAEC